MSIEQFLNAFRGRASRIRFWVGVAIVVPALMALVAASWVYAMSFPGAYENGGPTPLPTSPLGIAAFVLWCAALAALGIGFLAVVIRRLHDRDKAWWWVLIFIIVPDALYAYGRYQIDVNVQMNPGLPGELPFLFAYAAVALYLWGLVELGFLRGTAGDNRYGRDPLA